MRLQSTVSVPAWRMPITIESYPHRDPLVTDEEATLLEQYATAPHVMIGLRAKTRLNKLQRFEKPFLDTIRLHAQSCVPVAKSRRHLFKYIAQTRRAFWAWPEETWIEVIHAVSEKQKAGTRFWMITFAYLFSGFLYVGADAPYGDLANAVFGKETVALETDKLSAPLFELDYSQNPSEKKKLHQSYAMIALVNRSPYVETFSTQALVTVNEFIADLPDSASRREKKQEALILLQTSLCSLGIFNEPAILTTKRRNPTPPRILWQDDPTIDPT